MTPIRVVLADDHALFLEGMTEVLACHDGLEVVGEAATGERAIAVTLETRPDVLLLDVEMPGPGAAAVIRHLRDACPETSAVVLTMHDDAVVMRELLDCGAAAYLTKAVRSDGLVAAMRSVRSNPATVPLSVSWRTLGGLVARGEEAAPVPLTVREREILHLVARAMSNSAIAERLGVTPATVKRHLTNVYAKLNAASRIDAVRKASEAKLLGPTSHVAGPRSGRSYEPPPRSTPQR
ncbi:response regulator [Sphaerisporangium aureirubrum]|uniref:Response regulator n=1 Tax=Sphaerisporangium aureirubrum TaxID=1544736 RepID=A0ABW1NHH4_9ACTN